jgi:flavin reductase (DIM6/NTAB) family NADH-FMN oxidoreductase RutF
MSDTHVTITPSVLYFGTPVVLLTSLNPDGTSNISPISSAWALGDRVIIGLGQDGHAMANLHRDGRCVLNLPSADLWPQVERIARATGSNPVPDHKQAMGYVHVADKFALGGLTPQQDPDWPVASIAECPMQLTGTATLIHEDAAIGYVIMEVTVTQVRASPCILLPNGRHIDTERWHPLFYVFRHYVGGTAPLGWNFRAAP